MTELEQVIKRLECCCYDLACDTCPYYGIDHCIDLIKQNVLDLLNAQKEIIRCENCRYSCACYSDDGEDLYDCCKDVIFGNAVTGTLHTPDWFCADGKRSQNG